MNTECILTTGLQILHNSRFINTGFSKGDSNPKVFKHLDKLFHSGLLDI